MHTTQTSPLKTNRFVNIDHLKSKSAHKVDQQKQLKAYRPSY